MSDEVVWNIKWDESGEKIYELGLDRGVLYDVDANGDYSSGVAWNGLTAVNETPSGAEATKLYADNIIYATMYSAEEFGGTIEAYTYPDKFKKCIGESELATGVSISQQSRKPFGFSYRTKVGNDTNGDDYGYKIHLVYGAKASASERAYNTVNDSPEAITFSYEFTTVPVNVTGFEPTSLVIVDSRTANPTKLANLEDILYGKDAVTAADAVYEVVPGTATFSQTTDYYTRTGSGTTESPYSYTKATGLTEFANGTTYYTLKSPAVEAADAVDPRLPLPDEVKTILS